MTQPTQYKDFVEWLDKKWPGADVRDAFRMGRAWHARDLEVKALREAGRIMADALRSLNRSEFAAWDKVDPALQAWKEVEKPK